jgi:beta-glucosidase
LDRPEDRLLLRKVAVEAIVLLKNEDNVLPLDKSRTVAVVGPNAQVATYCGGGSAALNPYAAVTPFKGIANAASGGVKFSEGVYGHQKLPLLGKRLRTPDGRAGFVLRIFNEPPTTTTRIPIEERHETDAMVFFLDYSHPKLQSVWYADAEGSFTPDEPGI